MGKRESKSVEYKDFYSRIEEGKCPWCNKLIGKQFFRDKLSRHEFRISGLCQACQDSYFDESQKEVCL